MRVQQMKMFGLQIAVGSLVFKAVAFYLTIQVKNSGLNADVYAIINAD